MNLLRDPWIRTVSGERMSILGLLRYDADDLYGTTPAETMGVYRLLLAIVNDIYPDGRINGDHRLDAFAGLHGRRFDVRGFMQDSGFSDSGLSPVWRLTFDQPTGSYAVHFTHRSPERPMCAACIAHAILALSPFATQAGGGFRPSINQKPPLYVMPLGGSVKETLALSMRNLSTSDRLCAYWRRDPSQMGEVNDPVSIVQGLTWTPRRVNVQWQDGIATCPRCGDSSSLFAQNMYFTGGDYYRGETWRDPFVLYRVGREDKILPVGAFGVRVDWTEFCQKMLADHGKTGRYRCIGFVTDQARFDDTFCVDTEVTDDLLTK